jgi:hypothetical protein
VKNFFKHKGNLGFGWYVLNCGHLFCEECFDAMVKNENSTSTTYEYLMGISGNNRIERVTCAMCREINTRDDAYLVSTKRAKEVTGTSSTASVETSVNFAQQQAHNLYDTDKSHELSKVKIKGISFIRFSFYRGPATLNVFYFFQKFIIPTCLPKNFKFLNEMKIFLNFWLRDN